MPPQGIWTDELVEDLKLFWAAGFSAGHIARKFGTTRNTIIGKLKRMGLMGANRFAGAPAALKSGEKWSEEDDAILRREWAAGCPLDMLARLVGRTRSSVTHRALFLGLGPHVRTEASRKDRAVVGNILRRKQRAKVAPVPEVPIVIEPLPASRVLFLERDRRRQCAWPLWRDGHTTPLAERYCCGAAILVGARHPYCTTHLRVSATGNSEGVHAA